jgi:hypothetical protein
MADRVNFYFGQSVAEDELDKACAWLENGQRDAAVDSAAVGIMHGLEVSQAQPAPNLTVRVVVGASYDQLGRRCALDAVQSLSVETEGTTGIGTTAFAGSGSVVVGPTTVTSGGNEKWVSIFIVFDRLPADPRTDGNSNPVMFEEPESFRFKVVQGLEAPIGAAVKPTLPQPNAVLLADIRRSFGQTTVLDSYPTGDIDLSRRELQVSVTGTTRSLQRGRVPDALADLLSFYNNHVEGTADRHTGAHVDIASSDDWPDGSTNPSADLQTRLSKIVSDLAAQGTLPGAGKIGAGTVTGDPALLPVGTVASQLADLLLLHNQHVNNLNAHAAIGVTYEGNTTGWADAVPHPAASVEVELDKIVEDLGSLNGGLFIGASATGSAPYALTAGSVKSQINQLRQFIDDLVAGEITYDGSGFWADGSTSLPSGTVNAALDTIVAQLAASAGATRIGVQSIGTWHANGSSGGQVGDGALAGVQEALASIVADLADTNAAGDNGASRVGAPAQSSGSFSVASGSVRSQVAELLAYLNALSTTVYPHNHSAADITSGTLSLSVIPNTLTGKDADTVDGQHASAFALTGHNHDAAYAAIGHNHDAVYGRLAVANVWSEQNTFDGVAGDQNAALETNANPSTRKLVHRIRSSATTFFRWYATSVGLELTYNARWDGSVWQRDDGALYSTKHTMFVGLFGPSFDVKSKAVGTSFGDGAWDATANMNTSGVTIGQDPATAYAALAGAVPSDTAQAQVGTSWNEKVAFGISSATLTPPGGYGGDTGVSALLAGSFTLFGCQLNATLSGAAGTRFGYARYITTP